jgi:putative phosphoesterase
LPLAADDSAMPTELAVISDTHVPGREPAIPEWVSARVRAADHTIHAGDFDAPETLETVRGLATELTAVAGNVDPPTVDLPTTATVEIEDVTFVVVHGTGPHESWPERVAALVEEAVGGETEGTVVGIAGHTHTPTDTVVAGRRLLNPGSATGARPATGTTMLTVRIDGDAIDVEPHAE